MNPRRLNPDDICQGAYHKYPKSCAVGWGWTWWKTSGSHVFKNYLARLSDKVGCKRIADWNDHSSPEEVAKTINEVLEEMGLIERLTV